MENEAFPDTGIKDFSLYFDLHNHRLEFVKPCNSAYLNCRDWRGVVIDRLGFAKLNRLYGLLFNGW